MFDLRRIQSDFGEAAACYEEHANLQRVVRRQLMQFAKPHIAPRARVLDVGCGTGALAKEATAQQWRITGLDIAGGMCAEAKKNYNAVNANATAMPFADESFDGVFSSLMLQWSDTPGGVYREMARVLRYGAYAAIATLTDGTLHELRQAFAALDGTPHVNDFAPAHVSIAQAQEVGLSLVIARQLPLMEHYPDVVALMRGLQIIGAGNKNARRKRGLMTPRQLTKLERTYRMRYHTPQGLQASWHVLFLLLRKV